MGNGDLKELSREEEEKRGIAERKMWFSSDIKRGKTIWKRSRG